MHSPPTVRHDRPKMRTAGLKMSSTTMLILGGSTTMGLPLMSVLFSLLKVTACRHHRLVAGTPPDQHRPAVSCCCAPWTAFGRIVSMWLVEACQPALPAGRPGAHQCSPAKAWPQPLPSQSRPCCAICWARMGTAAAAINIQLQQGACLTDMHGHTEQRRQARR